MYYNILDDKMIFTQKELYVKRRKELEIKKEELENKIISIESSCPHNFILVYSKEKKDSSTRSFANCLVCGSYLELEDNFEIFSEEEIDNNSIIDISDKVSLESQNTFINGTNVLVKKAQKFLKDEMNIRYYRSYENIKLLIENKIIEYDKKYSGKKLVKKYK